MDRKANPALSIKLYVSKKKDKIDTRHSFKPFEKNHHVLNNAFTAWYGLYDFRKEASRNECYTFVNQWGDLVSNAKGKGYITEEQLIKNQGNVPLTNNRIRSIVRSILGVFSSSQTEPVCVSRDREKQTKGEMIRSIK